MGEGSWYLVSVSVDAWIFSVKSLWHNTLVLTVNVMQFLNNNIVLSLAFFQNILFKSTKIISLCITSCLWSRHCFLASSLDRGIGVMTILNCNLLIRQHLESSLDDPLSLYCVCVFRRLLVHRCMLAVYMQLWRLREKCFFSHEFLYNNIELVSKGLLSGEYNTPPNPTINSSSIRQ